MRVWAICLLTLFVIMVILPASAQCAMCRATLENNVSHGHAGLAPHLNTGILYLFAMPYVLVAFVAFFWYRKSKKNAQMGGHTAG